MWYIYAIIGIYLILPLIHSLLHNNINDFYKLTIILFIFNILLPAFKDYLIIRIDFPISNYVFYVCFGSIISQKKVFLKNIQLLKIASILIISYFILNPTLHFEYTNILVCILSITIFIIVENLNIKENKFIQSLSNCSWGIYIIHPLFINIIIKLLNIDLLKNNPYINLLLFGIFITFISYIFTLIIKKTPILKKIV